MTDPTDIVAWLRSILHNDRSVELRCQEAANEIEHLRKERDEARRCACATALPSNYKEWESQQIYAAVQLIAQQQGWDCFKETK